MIVVQIVVNRVNQSQVHKLYTSSRKRAQIDCSTVTLYILLLFQIHQFPSCVMRFRSCMQFSLKAFTFEQRTFKKNLLLLDRVLSLVKNKSQKKLTRKTLSSLFLSASKSRRRRLLLILLLLCRVVVVVVLPPFSHV